MSNKQAHDIAQCGMYIFLRQGHHVRPQILKQHVAGIEVGGLFDLKKGSSCLAFDVS